MKRNKVGKLQPPPQEVKCELYLDCVSQMGRTTLERKLQSAGQEVKCELSLRCTLLRRNAKFCCSVAWARLLFWNLGFFDVKRRDETSWTRIRACVQNSVPKAYSRRARCELQDCQHIVVHLICPAFPGEQIYPFFFFFFFFCCEKPCFHPLLTEL